MHAKIYQIVHKDKKTLFRAAKCTDDRRVMRSGALTASRPKLGTAVKLDRADDVRSYRKNMF